jgi:adenylate cyclase class 2
MISIFVRAYEFKNTSNGETIKVMNDLKSFFLKCDLLEAEIKIPIDGILPDMDPKEYIIEKIGPPMEEIYQKDLYFQNPIKDFSQTDEALRIREIQIKNGKQLVEITYKGPKIGSELKIREELTIKTGDIREAIQLFKKLGFKTVLEVAKTRVNWHYKAFIISLDDIKGLGKFIEIETQTHDSNSNLAELKEKLTDFTRQLFPQWDGENMRQSYLELLLSKSGFGR